MEVGTDQQGQWARELGVAQPKTFQNQSSEDHSIAYNVFLGSYGTQAEGGDSMPAAEGTHGAMQRCKEACSN